MPLYITLAIFAVIWAIFMFGFIPVIITFAIILGAYFYGKAVNSYLGIHVGIHKDIKTL